jgi:molybdopterin-guanine dinucleotide biosynthesis protein B
MKVVAIVGSSGSGKTLLIQKLIPELKSRGFSVAVIKHCSQGFRLDLEGKDTWKFGQAGSDGVALISPKEIAVLQRKSGHEDDQQLAARYFRNTDFILIEGRHAVQGIPKIEVLCKGIARKVKSPLEELAAVVSDFDLEIKQPVFRPDQIKQIADFLQKSKEMTSPDVILDIDGQPVPLNPFVQKVFENMLWGLVRSLKDIPLNARKVTLSLIAKDKKDERL